MLSAVENHFGPGRPYPTTPLHYGSQNGANLLTTPIVALQPSAAMSPNEFARPHPKTAPNRYNGGQSLRGCNGLSASSRVKYSQSIDQSSPVNLAVSSQGSTVNHKTSSPSTAPSASSQVHGDGMSPGAIKSQPHSQSEQDALHQSFASLYAPSKAYSTAEAVAAYQHLNYPNLYNRPPIYDASALYPPPPPPHALTSARNGLHRTAYDSYVHAYGQPSATYSPPAPARPDARQITWNRADPRAKFPSDRTSTSSSSSSTSSSSSNPSSPSAIHLQHNDPNAKLMSTVYRSVLGSKEKEPLTPNSASEKLPDFKVPSGKEGSLKHRILTRPYGEKEPPTKQPRLTSNQSHTLQVRKNSGTSSNVTSGGTKNNNNNISIHNKNNGPSAKFSKGSLIELASGELKRVEDMRAEDFSISSLKNSELQVIDTTVLKMSPNARGVVITFTFNNSTIDIESLPGHPFFVYGKGWASCNPNESLDEYNLKCQQLEVGDIFISLTPRDLAKRSKRAKSPSAAPPSSQPPFISHQPQYYAQPQLKLNDYTSANGNNNPMCAPQNLSRKQPYPPTSSTTTTTAVTAMPSRPMQSFDYQTMAFNAHQQHRLIVDHAANVRSHYNQSAAAVAAANAAAAAAAAHASHYRSMDDRRIPSNTNALQRTLSHDSSPRKYNLTSSMAPPPPPQHQSQQQHMTGAGDANKNGDANSHDTAAARANRQRRWSAPDAICNVDGCQLEQRKCTKH